MTNNRIPKVGETYQSIISRNGHGDKIVTIDFVKNNLVVWTYENDREELTLSTKLEYFMQDFVRIENDK